MAYQVIDWNEHYENAKSRTVKSPSWCAIPNKQSGLSYRRMVREHPDFYAVFVGIVLACSAQPGKIRDGWLTHDGTPTGQPWTPEDLQDKTGFKTELVAEALPYLSSERIGWLANRAKPKKGKGDSPFHGDHE